MSMSMPSIADMAGNGGNESPVDAAGVISSFGGLGEMGGQALASAAAAGNTNTQTTSTGAKTGGTVVFGNQSQSSDLIMYIMAGLAALFILKKK